MSDEGGAEGPEPQSQAGPQQQRQITSTSIFALKPLDDREALFARIGAGLGAVTSTALAFALLRFPVSLANAAMGVVLSGLMAWAAHRRSRFLAGLAAFMLSLGFPLEFAGTPWLLLGMYLWLRGRPTPEEAAERRRLRQEQVAARRAAKRGETVTPTTGKKPPPPSKRYTPPARTSRRR